MTENDQKTCKDRIGDEYSRTMIILRDLWRGYNQEDCPDCEGTGEMECGLCWGGDPDCPDCEGTGRINIECSSCEGTGITPEDNPDYGNLWEYGLSFDWVSPNTFNDQKEPYWRYQLSWGGPSDEFRFYGSLLGEYNVSLYRIEYWFLDWFDGSHIRLTGEDYDFMSTLFCSMFVETGTAAYTLREGLEE